MGAEVQDLLKGAAAKAMQATQRILQLLAAAGAA